MQDAGSGNKWVHGVWGVPTSLANSLQAQSVSVGRGSLGVAYLFSGMLGTRVFGVWSVCMPAAAVLGRGFKLKHEVHMCFMFTLDT